MNYTVAVVYKISLYNIHIGTIVHIIMTDYIFSKIYLVYAIHE